jgi:hypothetical protein
LSAAVCRVKLASDIIEDKVSTLFMRKGYTGLIPASIPGVLFPLVEELQAAADNALRNDRN